MAATAANASARRPPAAEIHVGTSPQAGAWESSIDDNMIGSWTRTSSLASGLSGDRPPVGGVWWDAPVTAQTLWSTTSVLSDRHLPLLLLAETMTSDGHPLPSWRSSGPSSEPTRARVSKRHLVELKRNLDRLARDRRRPVEHAGRAPFWIAVAAGCRRLMASAPCVPRPGAPQPPSRRQHRDLVALRLPAMTVVGAPIRPQPLTPDSRWVGLSSALAVAAWRGSAQPLQRRHAWLLPRTVHYIYACQVPKLLPPI